MSTSQPQNVPTPEAEDQDMSDQASTPDSPIEPTGAQLQASDVNDSSSQPPQFQTSTSNGKTLDESLAKYGAPGSSWTSKKFMEEYDLAVQKLCHQEFDPAKYGDPLMQ